MIDFPVDWQTCVALFIVACAAIALFRRFMGFQRKSDPACGGCKSCVNRGPNESIRKIELFQLKKKTSD